MKLLILLLLAACSTPAELGGQEGEPIAPPPPESVDDALEPDPDFDSGADGCFMVQHCAGPGWCAEYGEGAVPADLAAECEAAGGTVGDGPCPEGAPVEVCSWDEVCAEAYIYEGFEGDPEAFCAP